MPSKTDNRRPIAKLTFWDKNPKDADAEDIERLKLQIERLGEYKPLLITDDGTVIGGNQRLRALQELAEQHDRYKTARVQVIGFSRGGGRYQVLIDGEVVKSNDGEPVTYATKEAAMVEYALSDNDQVGHYEPKALAELLGDHQGVMPIYKAQMRKPSSLSEVMDRFGEMEEDQAPDADKKNPPKSKAGTVYQMGPHRLMCGDSTNEDDFDKLMNGRKADLIFTDPPYNVDYEYNVRYFDGRKKRDDRKAMFNDDSTPEDFRKFIKAAFQNAYRHTKDGAPMYCWHSTSTDADFKAALVDAGWHISQVLIWLKENITFATGQDYHRIYEPCFFGWKKGNKHFVNKSYATWSEVMQLDYESFLDQMDVLYHARDKSVDYQHPTQKPVRLSERALKKHSDKGSVVLDMFGGSGSTMMGCQQMDRAAYMMELDPVYCDVIRKRYAKAIGREDEWQKVTPAA